METFITSWQEDLVENNHWCFDNNLTASFATYLNSVMFQWAILHLWPLFFFIIACHHFNKSFNPLKNMARTFVVTWSLTLERTKYHHTHDYVPCSKRKRMWHDFSRTPSFGSKGWLAISHSSRARSFLQRCEMTCSHFWSAFVLRWERSFCRISREHGHQPSLSVGLPILTP